MSASSYRIGKVKFMFIERSDLWYQNINCIKKLKYTSFKTSVFFIISCRTTDHCLKVENVEESKIKENSIISSDCFWV